MDELEISGKRYISTRRAAKEHKYHSDYIGQLIRAGKVEGQKVGRSWYVIADSLAEYLGKEGTEKSSATRASASIKELAHEEAVETEAPVEQVEEVLEHVVLKAPVKIEETVGMEAEVDESVEMADEEELEELKETEEIEEAQEEIKIEQPRIIKTKIVEKEEIDEDAEEHHIPLKIHKPIQVHKPVAIRKEIPAIKTTRTSLRYMADDGPLYPRGEVRGERSVKSNIRVRSVEKPVEIIKEETVYIEEEPVTIIEKPQRAKVSPKSLVLKGGVVLVAGILTLGAVTAVSAFVVSTTTIQGDTASVNYALSVPK